MQSHSHCWICGGYAVQLYSSFSGHVDTRILAGSRSPIERTSWCNNKSLSFLIFLYFCLFLALSMTLLHGFHLLPYVETFRSSLCEKVLTSAIVFFLIQWPVFFLVALVHVSTREQGCAVVSGGCVSSTCILLPYFSSSCGLQVSHPHYILKWPSIMDEIHKCQEGTLLLITVAKAASISPAGEQY